MEETVPLPPNWRKHPRRYCLLRRKDPVELKAFCKANNIGFTTMRDLKTDPSLARFYENGIQWLPDGTLPLGYASLQYTIYNYSTKQPNHVCPRNDYAEYYRVITTMLDLGVRVYSDLPERFKCYKDVNGFIIDDA